VLKTIHICASTTTQNETFAIPLDASLKRLPSTLILEGATNGRTVNQQFGTYPNHGYFSCQENTLMDNDMMHQWIDQVLVPQKMTKPPGVVPIMVLDAYCIHIHIMGMVVHAIRRD
jgi:hypothetical protein